jgi:glycosyltransferase involved in cell wall biosynthesis
MQAISQLFESTKLLITQPPTPPPDGLIPLHGKALSVQTLPTPGAGIFHKLRLFPWVVKHLPRIWREVARADAVHAAVPGDVGTIGMLVALLQRKRLFVRHCGTFGEPVTLSDRLLLWILERIAGGRNVVMATGGAELPPSRRNPNISWIFATTLSRCEIDEAPRAPAWQPGEALRLVTVGRLAASKNLTALLGAVPAIQAARTECILLDIVGDGEERRNLEAQARALGLEGSVTFHGNVDHAGVLRILSGAHLFVFPTRVKEGFPKALLEALACGLPVIATGVSVIPQLLRNGSGLLLREPGEEAVARAVLEVLSQPVHFRRMKSLARQAAQGYSLEAWGEAIGRRLQSAWGRLA